MSETKTISITLTFAKKDNPVHLKQTINHISKKATNEDIKALGTALATLDNDLTYINATKTETDNI